MPVLLNDALEWLDRAEAARTVAGQLTDPTARKAGWDRTAIPFKAVLRFIMESTMRGKLLGFSRSCAVGFDRRGESQRSRKA
jgi:hypothetical protein